MLVRSWFEIILSLCAYVKLALHFAFFFDIMIPQSIILLDCRIAAHEKSNTSAQLKQLFS